MEWGRTVFVQFSRAWAFRKTRTLIPKLVDLITVKVNGLLGRLLWDKTKSISTNLGLNRKVNDFKQIFSLRKLLLFLAFKNMSKNFQQWDSLHWKVNCELSVFEKKSAQSNQYCGDLRRPVDCFESSNKSDDNGSKMECKLKATSGKKWVHHGSTRHQPSTVKLLGFYEWKY